MLEEATPDPSEASTGLRQRAARNTGALLAGAVASRLVGLFAVGYIARRFDAQGVGAYNLTIAFTAVFALLADLGLSTYVAREAAARPRDEHNLLWQGTLGALAAGLVAFALCNAVALLVGYDDELRRWILIVSVVTLLGPALLPLALLQARLKGHRVLMLMLAAQAMSVAAAVFVVVARRDIETYIVLGACANVAYAGLVIAATGAFRHYRGRVTRRDLRAGLRLLFLAAPLGMIMVIALVHARLDTFILSVISNDRSVGFYSAAWKLSEILHFVPAAVGASVIPIVVSQADLRRDAVTRGLRAAFHYLALLGIPLLVGAAALAEPLVVFVYGPGFEPAADPYRVLMLAEVSYFFGGVAAATLVGMRMVRPLVTIQAITVPANGLACALLLPRFDYHAAAWITFGAEFVTAVYLIAVVMRLLGGGSELLPVRPALQAILACLPMVAAVLLLDQLPVLARVGVGAVVYATVLVLVGAIGREEARILRSLVGRRRA